MKGRKLGTGIISVTDMETIVRLTKEGLSRREIAHEIGCCKMTIYNYQRKLLG